jgi:hypothetical protein
MLICFRKATTVCNSICAGCDRVIDIGALIGILFGRMGHSSSLCFECMTMIKTDFAEYNRTKKRG